MKFATLFKVMGLICLVLSVVSFISIHLLLKSFEEYRASIAQQIEYRQLGINLADASDYLTDEARRYAVTGDSVHYDNYWREVNETKTRDHIVERLIEMGAPDEEIQLIEAAKNNSDALIATEEAAMAAVEQNNLELARELMFNNQYDEDKAMIMQPIEEFQQKMNVRSELESQSAEKQANTMIILTLTMVILLVLAIISIFTLLYFRLIKRLPPIMAVTEEIARGNFTSSKLEEKGKDEIAVLSKAINTMSSKLSHVLHQVTTGIMNGAEKVASSAEQLTLSTKQATEATNQIAASISDVAHGAEVQVNKSEESGKAMKELTKGIQQVAETSAAIANDASEVSDISQNGQESVEKSIQKMNDINEKTQQTNSAIHLLQQDSIEIGKIIQMITDISEQTNLLSLNAAIEAARAGEAGKGFAVVADEIRKLSDQTGQSASKIKGLINNIQTNTEQAVHSMNSGKEKVEEGMEGIREVGQLFYRLTSSINSVLEQISTMSHTSEIMSASSTQVAGTFNELEQTAKDSAYHSQQVAAASEEQLATIDDILSSATNLFEMADKLKRLVQQFKI
ncbi:methyl-accepting chemotaxis protein [Halalkalibacterium ligniniphilum]|uniref:methyl-accepting chemotaxis protein n=1 Tax=Halalkalibacterium ligniniphilum TaxID=1134413 RepID=UPI000346458B|nr:HAMP domain-containing methyl-accepting chemotaxis protein [Halalkalibacterium ligniniphilum]